MKRSAAIWLVGGVIAVAAALMYFVVMPQIRDGKAVEEIAKKAEEAVKDVKDAVNDAGKQVEEAADGVEELKAAVVVKMTRIGQDARGATDELKALFDKGTPTAEQITAGKARLAAALKAATELKLPAEADAAATAAATRAADGARAALAALDALPADPAAARAALADLEAKLIATLPDGLAVKPADAAQPADTDKPAATDDGAAKTDAKADPQAADAAVDAAAPAETAQNATKDAATPAFDILRVEKDGSTVIAGRAEPGAKVEIVNGDKVIAATQADTSGDFAAVLDDPLSSGDHSITLKATTKDGKSSTSEEVATVSVPRDAAGELLAMVTKPGQASKIITMPETTDAEIASNKAVTPDASQEAKTADGAAPAAQETATAQTQDAAKADAAKAADTAKTAADTAGDTVADVAIVTPDLPATSSDIAATPPVVTPDDAAGTAEQQQTASANQPAADTSATPADAAQQAERTQPAGAPDVMVSAVELEGDRIFIAGNARPGATVRVYADDQVVAEATADKSGRFVADGTIKLAIGNHTIRADVLSADGARVELRASVPFFRPEGDLAAVASSDATTDRPAIEPLANGAFDKARDEAGKALTLLQGLYAGGKTPTMEELAAARSSAEIALKSLAAVRVADDVDPSMAKMAAKASEEAGKAFDRLKAVPADVAAFKSALGEVETIVGLAVRPATEVASASDAGKTVTKPAAQDTTSADTTGAKPADGQDTDQTVDKAGDQVSSDDVQVTAKVDRLASSTDAKADPAAADRSATDKTATDQAAGDKTAADNSAATTDGASAATGSQAATGQTASADQPKVIEQAPLKQSDASVIIRRGDTLWQISRRVYGRGVRYTTIYVANKTQIEDPDRIKPGQVFSMPGKWLDNAEELHKERLSQE